MAAYQLAFPEPLREFFAVHQKFGKLSIEAIMQPVIALAKKGVVVTEKQKKQIQDYQKDIVAISGNQNIYASKI